MSDLPAEALMPRIPKVVGVRIPVQDGLWKDLGERPVQKGQQTARGRRGNASRARDRRLEPAWREEDGHSR